MSKNDLNIIDSALETGFKEALGMVLMKLDEVVGEISVLKTRVDELEKYVEKTQGWL